MVFSVCSNAVLADIVRIEGHVFDPSNGRSIARADITIVDTFGRHVHTSTDSNGWYRAIGIAPGEIRLFVNEHARVRLEEFTDACFAPSVGVLRDDVELGQIVSPSVYTRFPTSIGPFPTICSIEPDTRDLYIIR